MSGLTIALGFMGVTLAVCAVVFQLGSIEDKLEVAEIAGTRVPPVSCQEDEAIWWTGKDTLGCVYFEEVR